MDHVQKWLTQESPDVLCLQETKVPDSEFPTDTFARYGYETVRAGQKSYNGVAILARHPITDVFVGLNGGQDEDDRRLISATVRGVRVMSAYVPNGKSLDSPSFREKLTWLESLRRTLDLHEDPSRPLVLGGDFNVARDDRDVFDAARMRGQIHFTDDEHAAIDRILDFGLKDAFRLVEQEGGLFSWWDYRMMGFQKNRGLRIDYLFVSDPVARSLSRVEIDRNPRAWDKPSDHTPVVLDFEL